MIIVKHADIEFTRKQSAVVDVNDGRRKQDRRRHSTAFFASACRDAGSVESCIITRTKGPILSLSSLKDENTDMDNRSVRE